MDIYRVLILNTNFYFFACLLEKGKYTSKTQKTWLPDLEFDRYRYAWVLGFVTNTGSWRHGDEVPTT